MKEAPKTPDRWKRLPRFTLSGMLIVVTLIAVCFGVIVNRSDRRAESLVLWERTEPIRHVDFPNRQFVDRLLSAPGVSALPTIKRQSNPEYWIQTHVTISPASDNDKIFRMSIEGNSYRDNASDLVPLLEAMIATLFESADGNDRRITVLTPPILLNR